MASLIFSMYTRKYIYHYRELKILIQFWVPDPSVDTDNGKARCLYSAGPPYLEDHSVRRTYFKDVTANFIFNKSSKSHFDGLCCRKLGTVEVVHFSVLAIILCKIFITAPSASSQDHVRKRPSTNHI